MIVHPPELQVKDGILRLSARIDYEKTPRLQANKLWFEMPVDYERYLSPGMDGFAASLVLVAMHRGEPLTLRGVISDRLAHGMEEYQHAITSLERTRIQRISVRAQAYESAGQNTALGVGLPFSGGVDSFYTLWSHIPPQEASPQFQITHGIFLQGVDVGYGETETMRACLEGYGTIFSCLELNLLTLRTNIRDLYPGADWAWTAFPPLAGVGLMLGKLFRRFYVAADATYRDWFPNHYPLLDQFFSTESLDIVSDGAAHPRWEKIETLSKWQPVRDSLRVCYTRPNGLLNCCRCPKCLHAMVCLELAGELQNVKTFPMGYTRRQLRSARYVPDVCSWIIQTRRRAIALGRRDIAFDLSVVIAASLAEWSLKHTSKKIGARVRGNKNHV